MSAMFKIIAVLPLSPGIRGRLYRLFVKRRNGSIGKNFRIGFGSYIDSSSISIADDVTIGNMVRIKFLDEFVLGKGSGIGSSTIICGAYEGDKFTKRNFICGDNVGILCDHYFDVVAPISIGNDVTIAGKWTQFYTHSFDLVPNGLVDGIRIGNRVYIGAASLVNMGVNICDDVVIQGGTCVNKDITEPGVYASQTFYKRGEVRNYSELFAGNDYTTMNSGVRVYFRKGNIDEKR